MNKKGDAMQFMMTYGWAILVLAGVISALAYFGVLDPKEIPPDVCMVGPGFGCKNMQATTGQFTLTIFNGAVQELSQVSIGFEGAVDSCTSATATNKADSGIPDSGTQTNKWWFNTTNATIREGKDIADFTFTGCSNSKRAVAGFSIYHTLSGEQVTHETNGEANLKVEH